MKYKTKANKVIEAVMIGKKLSDYPLWFHNGIMNKKIFISTEYSEEHKDLIVSKIKVKNIYGGTDLGFKDKDHICMGVAKEIFICRKAIFEFLYEKN